MPRGGGSVVNVLSVLELLYVCYDLVSGANGGEVMTYVFGWTGGAIIGYKSNMPPSLVSLQLAVAL